MVNDSTEKSIMDVDDKNNSNMPNSMKTASDPSNIENNTENSPGSPSDHNIFNNNNEGGINKKETPGRVEHSHSPNTTPRSDNILENNTSSINVEEIPPRQSAHSFGEMMKRHSEEMTAKRDALVPEAELSDESSDSRDSVTSSTIPTPPTPTSSRKDSSRVMRIISRMGFNPFATDDEEEFDENDPFFQYSQSLLESIIATSFWIVFAICFCVFIYIKYGYEASLTWMDAYILEWMFSFDNLFGFTVVYRMFRTPDKLKRRTLNWGILGAVIFRLIFLYLGEMAMNNYSEKGAQQVVGVLLIYLAFELLRRSPNEDDDDDMENSLAVKFLSFCIPCVPFVRAYDRDGFFCVNLSLDENGKPILPRSTITSNGVKIICTTKASKTDRASKYKATSGKPMSEAMQRAQKTYGTFKDEKNGNKRMCFTLLFVVLVAQELVDILFCVDSTGAIVGTVTDVFLAYSAVITAILGLRALYFVIDALLKHFILLHYGISIMLLFVGVKLVIVTFYKISPTIVCITLVSIVVLSVLGSILLAKIGLVEPIPDAPSSSHDSSPRKKEQNDHTSEEVDLENGKKMEATNDLSRKKEKALEHEKIEAATGGTNDRPSTKENAVFGATGETESNGETSRRRPRPSKIAHQL